MLRDRLPMRYRRRLAHARVRLRAPTAGARQPPAFVIIGAQRAGTSSLFRYLSAHPGVRRPVRKEIDYFGRYFDRGPRWYLAHFPLRSERYVSFDDTPDYALHHWAAPRCASSFPDTKIVLTVRDPVDRALSQYRHMRQLGFEDLPVAEAVEAEPARIAGDMARMREDEAHRPVNLLRFGYVARSRYGEQVRRWLEFFPREQLHVFSFDSFLTDPDPAWAGLLAFTGLASWRPDSFRNWSRPTTADPAPPGVRKALVATLGDDPHEFADLVGWPLPWPSLGTGA